MRYRKRFVLLMVALAIAACSADSALEVNMQQSQGRVRLEPHRDGSDAYQFMALVFANPTTRAVVNYNREADRTATIRYLTRGACASPRFTLEREVPAGWEVGGNLVRRYWRVEC